MRTLEKDITIKAPVDAVFGFVDEPTNLPKIWPTLYDVKNVSTLPNGGHRFSALYNMAGSKCECETETLERVVGERIVDRTTGDIESTRTWKFQGRNGQTQVALRAEYETPKPLPKDETRFFDRQSELEAGMLLESLRARFES